MIERLTLKSFKGHRDSLINLSPLTVLVGPNGAGKTSALEALHYLGQLYYKAAYDLFAGPRDPANLVHHGPGLGLFKLLAAGCSGAEERSLGVAVAQETFDQIDQQGDEYETRETLVTCRLGYGEGRADVVFDDRHKTLSSGGHSGHWPELRSAVFLRLDARRVAEPSVALERPRVEFDGGGTASVLANLKLTDEDRLGRIVADLRRVVPQIERVRVLPATLRLPDNKKEAGFRLVLDFQGGPDVPAAGASEGTLLTLALLTVLHGPSRPRLLLLDDVHEALHPRAQASLMKILLDLGAGPEPVQVVATTHSPFIVDTVEPSSVQVFAPRADGTTAIKSLAEHPEAASFRGALSTGQLWTLDDEQSWVVAGRP